MGSDVSVTELDVALKQHRMTTSLGEIAVAEAGDGPVLVMLHGGGPGASGVSNYHQNLPALSQRFRVVLPDQPGFGGSYRPSEAELDERSITEITVDALFRALDALGIDRFHLLGNSLGGAAALAMAQMRPELTDDIRALLVDNTPAAGSPPRKPPALMASHVRPSCNASSAAKSALSTSAPDARKACVSHLQPSKQGCSNRQIQRRSSVIMHPTRQ